MMIFQCQYVFMPLKTLELKKVSYRDNCEQLINLEDWFYWLSTSLLYSSYSLLQHALLFAMHTVYYQELEYVIRVHVQAYIIVYVMRIYMR